MGRKRSRRDNNPISNRRLPAYNYVSFNPVSRDPRQLALFNYEDRRTWHPEGAMRPARSFNSSRHRLRLINSPVTKIQNGRPNGRYGYKQNFNQPSHRIGFEAPEKTLICVRRKIRAEVLHAKKKAGKTGQKKPKFNYYSKIACRR